jgi:hypothetical protein
VIAQRKHSTAASVTSTNNVRKPKFMVSKCWMEQEKTETTEKTKQTESLLLCFLWLPKSQ